MALGIMIIWQTRIFRQALEGWLSISFDHYKTNMFPSASPSCSVWNNLNRRCSWTLHLVKYRRQFHTFDKRTCNVTFTIWEEISILFKNISSGIFTVTTFPPLAFVSLDTFVVNSHRPSPHWPQGQLVPFNQASSCSSSDSVPFLKPVLCALARKTCLSPEKLAPE